MRSEPIWRPPPSRTSLFIYVRQRFALSRSVAAGRLRCAGSGPYEVYLNGRRVGRGLGRVLTQEPVWDAFEIGGLLQAGENLLLAVAGEQTDADGASWFRGEGEIAYEDGTCVELGTGSSWEVLRADAWEAFAEGPLSAAYFAAQEPEVWMEGRFREEEWIDAAVVEAAEPLAWAPGPVEEVEVWAARVAGYGEIESCGELRFAEGPGPMAECKCVHREALLRPGRQQALVETRSPERAVYLVLDFGRTLTGFPRLRLRGPRGGVIDLGFARRWGKIETGLRYVGAEGRREWTSCRLESCRYVVLRLSHFTQVAELDCVSMVERRAQKLNQGSLAEPGSLRRIWEIGQHTVEACRQEIYYLSPGRAAYDWLRSYVFALNDYYLTGDCQTAAAMLDSARPPQSGREDLTQAVAYVLFAEAYHRYAGDGERGTALLPGVLETLDSCKESLMGGKDTASNALYAGALVAAARLCRRLKQRQQGGAYERECQQVRKILQQAWDEEQGLFADQMEGEGGSFSQWANALVLYFDLVQGGRRERIVEQIRRVDIQRGDDLLAAFFLAGGLWQAGAGERAGRYVEQRWGGLVEREGRTWGEKAGQEILEAQPGPEFFFGSRVLGVTPGAPGYRVLEIRPRIEGLQHAGGHLLTRRGAATVEWDHDERERRFSLQVELAEDGETRLTMPRLELRFPMLTLNGETVWRNEKVYPNAFVREVISEEEWVTLVVHRAGKYEVVVE